MKNVVIYCCGSLLLSSLSKGEIISISSSSDKCLQEQKVQEAITLIQKVKEGKIDPSQVVFDEIEIEAHDLSAHYLKGMTFNNCILTGYELKGIDLREINLKNTKFKDGQLNGAILWQDVVYNDDISFKLLQEIYQDLMSKCRSASLFRYDITAGEYGKKARQFLQIMNTVGLINIK